MKKLVKLFVIPFALLSLTGCDFISDVFGGGDTDTIHKKSYEPITGKFVLYEATDKRLENPNAYFEFDGTKGNFFLKYYENGELKREGQFQRIVTRKDDIGKIKDNLHLNVKVGNDTEHIGTYTESLDPINQFRIIEEYKGSEEKYYYSELPYILGTYVREGKEYKQEAKTTEEKDYLVPSWENFTAELNGKYALDDDHYFYFINPGINDYYALAYFQYFSSALDKPIEGFVAGRTYTNVDNVPTMIFTYSRQVSIYKAGGSSNVGGIYFGYYEVGSDDRLKEHWGTVDLTSDYQLNSFTFEHLSRYWTDDEMDKWTKDIDYHLPDPIFYEYIGGTYTKAQ